MTTINPAVMELLYDMTHSRLHNYVVPGLASELIGEPHSRGLVRMFTSERQHDEHIIPHSHRYDFACLVLAGWVKHAVWEPSDREEADIYNLTQLTYGGRPGQYEIDRMAGTIQRMEPDVTVYKVGEWYTLASEEIHSIQFSKDAVVLFFEGRVRTNTTVALEPLANGVVVPTLKTEAWMFKKG